MGSARKNRKRSKSPAQKAPEPEVVKEDKMEEDDDIEAVYHNIAWLEWKNNGKYVLPIIKTVPGICNSNLMLTASLQIY